MKLRTLDFTGIAIGEPSQGPTYFLPCLTFTLILLLTWRPCRSCIADQPLHGQIEKELDAVPSGSALVKHLESQTLLQRTSCFEPQAPPLQSTMSLLDLPPEILLQIITRISPNDIEAFGTTCNAIYSLATSRLATHFALKAQFHSVALPDDSGFTCPSRLLKRMWYDPWIAFYIKRMVFAPETISDTQAVLSAPGNVVRVPYEVHRRAMLKRTRMSLDLLRRSEYPDRNKSLSIGKEWAMDGEEGPAAALLLALLPNLEVLRLDGSEWNQVLLHDIFIWTSKAYRRSNLFKKLSIVEYSAEYLNPVRNLMPSNLELFTLLPSVRTLIGRGICPGQEIVDFAENFGPGPGLVERLELTDSSLWSDSLKYYLTMLPNLKHFQYSHATDDGVALRSHGGVASFVQTLAQKVGTSLESLTICDYPVYQTSTITSFHDFKVLRMLEIEIKTLCEYNESSFYWQGDFVWGGHRRYADIIPRIVDMLPPSLEDLTLSIGTRVHPAAYLLRNFGAEQPKRLPKLTRFTYFGDRLPRSVEAEIGTHGVLALWGQGRWIPQHVRHWDETIPETYALAHYSTDESSSDDEGSTNFDSSDTDSIDETSSEDELMDEDLDLTSP